VQGIEPVYASVWPGETQCDSRERDVGGGLTMISCTLNVVNIYKEDACEVRREERMKMK